MTGDNDDLQGLDDQQGQEQQEDNVNYEEQAKELGWVPEDKFKGDKSKWVSAEEFVQRGEKLMPILRANNERLKRELLTRDRQIDTLNTQLASTTEAVKKLEGHYSAANKRLLDEAVVKLKTELKEARESGDVDAEVAILGKIGEANTALQNADKAPVKQDPETPTPTVAPEVKAWQAEKAPWYGTDKAKTKTLNRIMEDLRDEGETAVGIPFLDAALAKFESLSEEPKPRPTSKVESGGRPSSGSLNKGWADLPADAKRACLADVETLVGPDKVYKTQEEWKKEYARIYFNTED